MVEVVDAGRGVLPEMPALATSAVSAVDPLDETQLPAVRENGDGEAVPEAAPAPALPRSQRVSQIRIRKTPVRSGTSLTPMGLPKAKR
uniref:Protein PRR14L n=1 Tax=Petromyzon marinus TaxID=7757 RepID=A0AAJ7UJK3_PETMA|nr:protein PRR14L [Petromyzon marinus]